ncbi:multidrug resistance protein MdtN [Symmachiella macrocystis]|uniref:Multidrug resistance protein MdtN n=1 Tax=Symmachiella macrocystis TaxID=2527985 RepID=A0A5C6B0N5_9PLAN|nr:HlyD family efflux transporter periplasmic adaptor subunit [Symmachiella macrocystis]TWU05131.1 multidrug resistance protein MdtN [Symmachiella macrocystis]
MIQKPDIDQVLEEMELYTEMRRRQKLGENEDSAAAPPNPPDSAPQFRGYQYTGTAIPKQTAENSPQPQADAHPTPVRPRGRLLTGLLLLGMIGFGSWQVWSTFFRFSAYGIVDSHRVQVSAPIQGTVQSVHARLGETLRQGQLILTINNVELEHQLEQTRDELGIEQARLSAETAKMNWQMRNQQLENDEAIADYYEAWARLESEVADQKAMEKRLARAEGLHKSGVLTSDQYEELFYERQGADEKIKKRRDALQAWRTRAEGAVKAGMSTDHIDPILARIDSLQAQSTRIEELIRQCEVRSPVNGRLTKWDLRTGEFAKQGDALFSIVEEESEYVKLFLPQAARDRFAIGDTVNIEIRPHTETIACVVERVADEFSRAPAQIETFYAPHEQLIAIELRPVHTVFEAIGVRSGAQVRLPKSSIALKDISELKSW